MGQVMYVDDQAILKNSLSKEFPQLYLAITHAYKKHGHSSKCINALKQFAEYFYRQAIQKRQYKSLRSQMIKNTLSSRMSQRCEIFSDDKISGYLYALPSTENISAELLQGNINILTVDHGAIQIERQSNNKFTMPSQRLTSGQSAITMKSKGTKSSFQAKTSVALFFCIACHEAI